MSSCATFLGLGRHVCGLTAPASSSPTVPSPSPAARVVQCRHAEGVHVHLALIELVGATLAGIARRQIVKERGLHPYEQDTQSHTSGPPPSLA